jgi:hypothetical protein
MNARERLARLVILAANELEGIATRRLEAWEASGRKGKYLPMDPGEPEETRLAREREREELLRGL